MELKDDLFENENEKEKRPLPTVNQAPTYATKEELPSVKLPLPEKDFNKKGKLKKVRGRVLKKLLKQEFRHYLPITLGLMGLLLFTALFCGLSLRSLTKSNADAAMLPSLFTVSSILLFILCCSGSALFISIYPIARYDKNFFKNEGYLTFSVPVSMEEHVFAKRIAAVVCSYAMAAVIALSIGIIALLVGGTGLFREIGSFLKMLSGTEVVGRHVVWYFIELALSALVGGVLTPSLYGALTCALSKITGKQKTWVVILIVFIAAMVLNTFSASNIVYGGFFPATLAWLHISMWISIIGQILATVACIFFEIWYLKKKLDLR